METQLRSKIEVIHLDYAQEKIPYLGERSENIVLGS